MKRHNLCFSLFTLFLTMKVLVFIVDCYQNYHNPPHPSPPTIMMAIIINLIFKIIIAIIFNLIFKV